MGKKLNIDRKDEGTHSLLALKGIIDEEADFKDAFEKLKPTVLINLEGIDLINSCGVREWVHAIQKIPPATKLEYDRCAPRIVEQINYVANFLGHGKVLSFFAPYFCPKCKSESNVLLETREVLKQKPIRAPQQKCPNCKGLMDFDDIEEEYFSFLESA